MVLSAICWQPRFGVEEVGTPMSRRRLPQAGRKEGARGCRASSRLEHAPAFSGGSRSATLLGGLDHAAAKASPQLKPRSSLHTPCMITASLRATATLARRMPMRAARARPHTFSLHSFGWRVNDTLAAANRYGLSRPLPRFEIWPALSTSPDR